jgi:hypothetical protein
MNVPLFTSAASTALHDIVVPRYRETIEDYAGESLDSTTALLLYVWAVAIGTTVFNEAERFTMEAADTHVADEAMFATTTLLPEVLGERSNPPNADDFLEAYQAVLLFIAYRIEDGADADEVVEAYMDNPPNVPEPEAFAEALMSLFVSVGEAAVEAAEAGPKSLN